ncbi:CheW-like domain protein [Vibrio mediterranei]|uniref:Chemotaxis protein CheW n=1 Tax=Vibrio mediterranei TaxID=689 RepID=A0ABX5D9R3_9VIBR|nr:chemotaxis protein CheW [Vibrio mediterranei]PCD88820.1 chemotaxis protein CheW [Vibrio mediterranei]PRQ66419.1 chemotaxis protein CheW [Vibrio mediterranei]SBO09664.1 CheW-like domain protein [Vibrio mediterranei]
MKADAAPLSSEQALDDYFTSLLGLEDGLDFDSGESEPIEVSELASVIEVSEAEASIEQQGSQSTWQPEPQLQLSQSKEVARTYDELIAEAEEPDLQHLEKLFSGLQHQSEAQALEESIVTEPDIVVQVESEQIAAEPATEEIQSWDVEETSDVTSDIKVDSEIADTVDVELVTADGGSGEQNIWQNGERTEGFQVLYFDVNGMTFAVPLDELGGIHQIGELNHLIGKPAWYLGLQSSRDSQLDVVDTAMWVMPDVLNDDSYKDAYEYIVMLGESHWGLASTELKGTELLRPEAVRWREKSGKRPWLAGMVKEQMCALVHVSELIDMLNAGLDVKSVQ